jgi:hypothetical protein
MKKRIKLTDEELAIGMWVFIYLKIKAYNRNKDQGVSITNWKHLWLKEHGLGEDYWYNGCLLCQRYMNERHRCKCPLSEGGLDCGEGSLYLCVLRYYYRDNPDSKKQALEACKEIIKIMIEEADKKHEVENSEEGE